MTQRKRAVNFILRVVCLLVAFACVTLLCWQYGVRKQGEAANEAMRQLYDPAASAEEALPEPQAAFSQLLDANPETVAYLLSLIHISSSPSARSRPPSLAR